jgi:O-antigen ligase
MLVLRGEASTRLPGLLPTLPQSALHRLEMWEFVAGRIEERPLLGYGLDGSRVLPGAAEPYRLGGGQVMGLHPHNAPLQIWVELGLPGAAFAGFALFVIFRRIGAAARSRSCAAAGIGAGVTALTIASLSFGIWQTWWLASLVLAAPLTAVVSRGIASTPQPAG